MKIHSRPEYCCGNCRCWREGSRDPETGKILRFDVPWGDCLRRPPSLIDPVAGVIFPRTHKDDICGEYKYDDDD